MLICSDFKRPLLYTHAIHFLTLRKFLVTKHFFPCRKIFFLAACFFYCNHNCFLILQKKNLVLKMGKKKNGARQKNSYVTLSRGIFLTSGKNVSVSESALLGVNCIVLKTNKTEDCA